MHVYIYDAFVTEKKYNSTIAKVETRLTDLGLNGKIVRINTMNSIYGIIENEIKKGAKTIIAVGDNNILNQSINSIARLSCLSQEKIDIPLAFIPIGGKNNNISRFFGLNSEAEACNCISARRIKTLDLGLINNYYFLTQVKIPTNGTIIEINESYSVETGESGEIYVLNLPVIDNLPGEINPNAEDGVLELYIKSKKIINKKNIQQSVFSFKKIKIINPNREIEIDDSIKIPTPAEITIAKEKINLIVNKSRGF